MALRIHTDGPRLCLACVKARIPWEERGAWTWGFGDCVCGHFGITVPKELVDDQAARLLGPAQSEINFLLEE